jgi:hypothetical protein
MSPGRSPLRHAWATGKSIARAAIANKKRIIAADERGDKRHVRLEALASPKVTISSAAAIGTSLRERNPLR